MKWLGTLILLLGLTICLAPAGCQNKETAELEVETNDTEHEIEWETTEE